MKFATKLTILLLGIVIVVSAIISYFVYISNLKTLEKEIKDRLEDQAFHIMDKIDRTLYERYSDIQLMASDPIISSRNSTPKQITERLIEYRNTYKTYVSLSFFDLNRIRIADTAGLHLGRQQPITKYWEDVLRDKVSAASDVRFSEALKMPCIYFASPVKDKNGETFGVVVARMPAIKLYHITKGAAGIHEKEEDLEIDLVDRDGLLLYSSQNRKGILKDNLSDSEAVKRSMLGEKMGSLIGYDPILNEKDIFVFVHEGGYLDFKGNHWTLLVHIPTEIVFAPAVELRNRVVAILLPTIGLSILIVLFFSHTVSRPIIKLTDAATAIGKGRLDTTIEVKSRDEIGELANSFNKMIEDLTKSRNELMAARDYTNSIIKSMVDILIVIDPEGSIKTINKAALDLLGYTEEELTGKPVGMIVAEEGGEEEVFFRGSEFKKLIKKGSIRDYDMTYKTKAGEKIPVSFSGSVMRNNDGELVGIVGIAHDMRERKRLMQGEKALVAAEATAEVERKKAEGLERQRQELENVQQASLNVMEDLDERGRELGAALKKLGQIQDQLIRSEKLVAVGQLAAGAAHEINNPLSSIVGYVQLHLKEIKDPEVKQDLERVLENAMRCKSIIRDLLNFSRKEEPALKSININNLIEDKIIPLISRQAGVANVKINRDYGPFLPYVMADPNLIQQAFVNIILNAYQAMPRGGEITIKTRADRNKKNVEVSISDTGRGILEEDIKKLFDPFFTTRPVGKGTGLGLAITHSIIERHRGEIRVESEVGKGTTFIVTLPVEGINEKTETERRV